MRIFIKVVLVPLFGIIVGEKGMNISSLCKAGTVFGLALLITACNKYGDFTEEHICRATLASIKGKSPSIMNVDKTTTEQNSKLNVYHFSFKRPDDGKKWNFRCKVNRNRAILAIGDGRWRDQAHDPTVWFTINGDEIVINERFPDGTEADDVIFNIHALKG